MKIKKAVILAAGFGTRLLPLTKSIPKEMISIFDRPAIELIVEECLSSGIDDILIVISRGKEIIENHFDKAIELEEALHNKNRMKELNEITRISMLGNIHFVRQKERLGTGHAVLCAETFVGNEPFAVILPDDLIFNETPCLYQLIEVYNRFKSSVIGTIEVPDKDISKYGIIDIEVLEKDLFKVNNIIEKPLSHEINSNIATIGRFILSPTIFDILKKTEFSETKELYLTDAIKNLAKIENVLAYNFEGIRYDLGTKKGYFEAFIDYALRDKRYKDQFFSYIKNIENI